MCDYLGELCRAGRGDEYAERIESADVGSPPTALKQIGGPPTLKFAEWLPELQQVTPGQDRAERPLMVRSQGVAPLVWTVRHSGDASDEIESPFNDIAEPDGNENEE